MNSLIAVRAVRTALNSGSAPWRRNYASQKGSSGSGPPKSTSPPPSASTKNVDPPSNIFKKVDSKVIGPGAGKDTNYKNPEYFCYHEMSYAEMDVVMAKLRLPQPSSIK